MRMEGKNLYCFLYLKKKNLEGEPAGLQGWVGQGRVSGLMYTVETGHTWPDPLPLG